MTIAVGESLPNVTLTLVTPDGPKPVATKDYFAGKTIVLFGLPGAFTPTCHKNHLPDFIANGSAILAKALGLDLDLTERGMGVRSKRYSMYIIDGVVKELNIEPQPGVADLSSAEHILGQIK